MAEISATMVKDLREKSGAGMMDCKKALSESEGDFQKAMNLLRERGAAIANKRSSRVAKEGLVAAYVSPDHSTGALIELNCESDFVARNDDFKKLSQDLATHAASVDNVDKINDSKMNGETVAEVLKGIIGKIGENIVLSRSARFKSDGSTLVYSYIHPPGKVGVLVEISTPKAELAKDTGFEEFARDIAMHVAAMAPQYLKREEVPSSVLENEKAIFRNQTLNEGKPEKIVEKIVEGRIQSFFKDACLLDQPFAKNADQKITDYVKQNAGKYGTLEIKRFVRFKLGEKAEAQE